jgi:hypothetical protein
MTTSETRHTPPRLTQSPVDDVAEILVADHRADARPAQLVEQRLMALLRHDVVLVSSLRTATRLPTTGSHP